MAEKQCSIRLPEDVRREIEEEARRRGMTLTALIRAVMTEFLHPGSVKL